MTGLTSLEQDIFLHIVPYIGGGPSALLQLGLVNKFFGQRPTQDELSLVEALAREMVGSYSYGSIPLYLLLFVLSLSHIFTSTYTDGNDGYH